MRLTGLDPDRKSYYSHVETWWYQTKEVEAVVAQIRKRVPKAVPHPSNPHCLKMEQKGRVYWFIVEEA